MRNPEKQIIQSRLSAGEHLLWFGRPRQGFFLRKEDAFFIPFTLFWCGFIAFWEWAADAMDAPLYFKLFGIPFVIAGFYMLVGRFFVDVWTRRKTYYGVTDQRIIIVSGLLNTQLKSLNLKTLADLTLTEKRDGSGVITFAPTAALNNYNDSSDFNGSYRTNAPIFDHIPQARTVYETIRRAQLKIQA